MYAERLYSVLSLAEHCNPKRRRPDQESSIWDKVKQYTKEALDCLLCIERCFEP